MGSPFQKADRCPNQHFKRVIVIIKPRCEHAGWHAGCVAGCIWRCWKWGTLRQSASKTGAALARWPIFPQTLVSCWCQHMPCRALVTHQSRRKSISARRRHAHLHFTRVSTNDIMMMCFPLFTFHLHSLDRTFSRPPSCFWFSQTKKATSSER